jgi:hypothetical protein
MEQILWCNWQTVYGLAESLIGDMDEPGESEAFVEPVRALASDLLTVLDIRGLAPFRPLLVGFLAQSRPDLAVVRSWLGSRPWFDLIAAPARRGFLQAALTPLTGTSTWDTVSPRPRAEANVTPSHSRPGRL